MSDVTQKGDKLSGLVGESEQPIVSTSVDGVNSEYDNLKETWKQRHDELNKALEQTNRFQADLVGILNWLQGIKLRPLTSVNQWYKSKIQNGCFIKLCPAVPTYVSSDKLFIIVPNIYQIIPC